MKKILVTGASGNVGREVIKHLILLCSKDDSILAGERDPAPFSGSTTDERISWVPFDFGDPNTFDAVLSEVDCIFLLRPPQLADTDKYFKPLIQEAARRRIKHMVFLSVQGADSNTVIPHHKIEKLITGYDVPFTFLRPAYFYQNFLTSLHRELVQYKRIFLPAGKAKFTLVDTRDIGEVAAQVLLNSDKYLNSGIELTSEKHLTFGEMAEILSEELGQKIAYKSPNLVRFFIYQRKQGVSTAMILVMIMLHYLPRFSSAPPLSENVKQITGHDPIPFEQFVRDHKTELTSKKK